jgi:hypothetical protein
MTDSVDYSAMKAMVSDSNGELSCSVDETNRLRAMLGLRPLRVEGGQAVNKEQESIDNFKRNSMEKER